MAYALPEKATEMSAARPTGHKVYGGAPSPAIPSVRENFMLLPKTPSRR